MISVLIIGLGRFGRHMAIKFQEQGNDVMAVEKDETRADEMAPVIQNIQIGDATNEDFLRSLGVGNYDVCVVGIGESFQTALEITVHLKDLGAKYVVARATRDIYKKLLLRNGADHVVYAEREVAERLAVRYGTARGIFDYVELTPEYGSMRSSCLTAGPATASWSARCGPATISISWPSAMEGTCSPCRGRSTCSQRERL